MAPARNQSAPRQIRIRKANVAKRGLTGRKPVVEDSDEDELTQPDWEFIYDSDDAIDGKDIADEEHGSKARRRTSRQVTKVSANFNKKIIAASRGQFRCTIGDCVMVLHDEDSYQAWSGIIKNFELDEYHVDGEPMRANIQWFANPSEVHESKRKNDVLENEVYISTFTDNVPIGSINSYAKIMSPEVYTSKYPKGVPRKSKDYGKTFICRRGCEYLRGVFTPDFRWEERYRYDEESMQKLSEWIDSNTKVKKTRKRKFGDVRDEDDKEFVVGRDMDQDDAVLKTPRKKQKTSAASTPQKLRTPSKLFTPSHKRVVIKKPLEITPLGTRTLSPSHVFGSPFQAARSRLHVSSVPDALPCREDEFATVYTHLEAAISDGTSACIYISGTPGTGKTATVREVVAQLNAAVYEDELEAFKFVEINGMKVTDPHQSYALLWEALKGDRVSPSHALDLLDREFSHPSPRRTPCVVLMDELDQLVTKNQSVMYNFFNWPSMRHSKLIVLAVANTMDLPERTLSNKISSRLGLTRITFSGYTHDQLMKIIQSRLEGVPGNIVEPDAIQFASRKVAAVSGDARRALDICRRAVELAEAESLSNERPGPVTPSKSGRGQKTPLTASKQTGKVTIATVKRAINEATTSPLQQYLRSLPLAAKVLLAALLAKMRRTGIAESVLGEVLDEAKRMAKMDTGGEVTEYLLRKESQGKGMHHLAKPVKAPRVLGMGTSAIDLMEAGIIGLEVRRADRMGKVRLSIGEEDVKQAFKDDPEIKTLGFSV